MSRAAGRPHRPARPPVQALDRFARLDDTHRRMLDMLARLETIGPLLADRSGGKQAAAVAAAACDFFHDVARQHHEAEETLVFPALLVGADPVLLGHVRQLQTDHDWLEEDWLELEPHLRAVAAGYGAEHAEFLSQALPEFTTLHRAHIALEEEVVYPEARRRRLRDAGNAAP